MMIRFILTIFIFINSYVFSQNIFSEPIFFVGPMIHFNFGNKEHHFSYGVEGSAWVFNSNQLPPLSADFGIEFEKAKIRVYSELQTGTLLGLSAGPVIEFERDVDPRLGFQSSVWGAFFLGLDMRYRRINKTNYFAPGIFFKFPVNPNQTSIF